MPKRVAKVYPKPIRHGIFPVTVVFPLRLRLLISFALFGAFRIQKCRQVAALAPLLALLEGLDAVPVETDLNTAVYKPPPFAPLHVSVIIFDEDAHI